MVADGGRAGESSRCEDPAPTGGIAIRIAPNAIVSMPYTMPHMETYGFYYDAACRVVVKTAGKRRGGRLRRGTPRRYVLRETGE